MIYMFNDRNRCFFLLRIEPRQLNGTGILVKLLQDGVERKCWAWRFCRLPNTCIRSKTIETVNIRELSMWDRSLSRKTLPKTLPGQHRSLEPEAKYAKSLKPSCGFLIAVIVLVPSGKDLTWVLLAELFQKFQRMETFALPKESQKIRFDGQIWT